MLLIITLSIFVISQIILSHYAKVLNLIDKPDDRKKHEGNIPTVGGVSLFLSLFIFYLLADISQNYKLILLTSLIVFLSGLLDDIFKLSVLTRVLLQLAACLILILNGFRVLYLGEYEILGNLESWSDIYSIFNHSYYASYKFNKLDRWSGWFSFNNLFTKLFCY